MSTSEPPTRLVTVPASRLPAWMQGFQRRHGGLQPACGDPWVLYGADGACARIRRPEWAAGGLPPSELGTAAQALLVGVVVVRRAAYLVAQISEGAVTASKLGTRHIHGRTAAGGWSQKRYSRRRANQAGEIVGSAAAQAGLLLPKRLDLLVTGGDRALLDDLLQAAPALSTARRVAHLAAGTPDRELLRRLPELVFPVQVLVTDGVGECGSTAL